MDSQSFPLEIAGFEDLSEKGAYSAGKKYTKNDVKDIVNYAQAVRNRTQAVPTNL